MSEPRTSEGRPAEARWRSGEVRTRPQRVPIRGPHAGGRKHDVLTALAAAGLSGTTAERCTALRLIAMITARYDWTSDSVAVGQAELARLWTTSLRTVKREMGRLTASGLLVCLAPGVQRRVGVDRLDPAALRRLTEGSWAGVDPDFAERMGAAPEAGRGGGPTSCGWRSAPSGAPRAGPSRRRTARRGRGRGTRPDGPGSSGRSEPPTPRPTPPGSRGSPLAGARGTR